MPTQAKPLFRPEALRPRLKTFAVPPAAGAARPRLGHWAKLLGSTAAEEMKETELLADFIRDVLGDLLGYTGPAGGSDRYTLKCQPAIEVDGKYADAALRRLTSARNRRQRSWKSARRRTPVRTFFAKTDCISITVRREMKCREPGSARSRSTFGVPTSGW